LVPAAIRFEKKDGQALQKKGHIEVKKPGVERGGLAQYNHANHIRGRQTFSSKRSGGRDTEKKRRKRRGGFETECAIKKGTRYTYNAFSHKTANAQGTSTCSEKNGKRGWKNSDWKKKCLGRLKNSYGGEGGASNTGQACQILGKRRKSIMRSPSHTLGKRPPEHKSKKRS